MKKLLIYILLACFALIPLSTLAQTVEVDLLPDAPEQPRVTPQSFFKRIDKTLVTLGKIDAKYANQDLEKADISADIAQLYPAATEEKIKDNAGTARLMLRWYRFGKSLYNKIKNALLTPPVPPLIVPEEQYDKPYEKPYIASPPDTFVLIKDFKKVLSYGSDRKDFEAMEAKYAREMLKKRPETSEEFLQQQFAQWQMHRYLKNFDNSPKRYGWEVGNVLSSRIISQYEAINNQPEVYVGLQILLKNNAKMLALNEGKHQKPIVSLENSDNIESFEVLYPMPQKYIDEHKIAHAVYTDNFLLPLLIKVKDVNRPLTLTAKLRTTVCSENLANCQIITSAPKYALEAGKGLSSLEYNVFYRTLSLVPNDDNEKFIDFDTLAVDKTDNLQTLRIVAKINKPVKNVRLFIEDDAGTQFEDALVSVFNNKLAARWTPLNKKAQLIGKKFTVTLQIDNTIMVQKQLTATSAKALDIDVPQLSLGLLLLAFLGGFLLNFMPCVFPVLSLKLLNVLNAKKQSNSELRKSFALTAVGIMLSFLLIAGALAIVKHFGHNIGWGMQFQSPNFLTAIIFIMVLFLAFVLELIQLPTPQLKLYNSALLGGFAVLVSTPCTAPYLGTAIGFALSGNVTDIFAMLSAVGLGLAVPYLLVAATPAASNYFPKPGKWMKILNNIMIIFLILTIIWLLSVLYAQTNLWPVIRLALYAGGFFMVILFDSMIRHKLKSLKKSKILKAKVQKFFTAVSLMMIVALPVIAFVDINHNFAIADKARQQNAVEQINLPQIAKELANGNKVLLKIGANWCLTCHFNDIMLNAPGIENLMKKNKIMVQSIDWTNYNAEVLQFMERFGRKGLPFYVLFTQNIPQGLVLPEVLTEKNLHELLNNAN